MKAARFVVIVCWIVLSLGLSQAARAQNGTTNTTPEQLWLLARQLAEQGQTELAIQAYQQLLKLGYQSPALELSLGNAYYQQQDFARAVQHYEYARALAPREPSIRANLAQARNQLANNGLSNHPWESLPLGSWIRLIQNYLSIDELALLALTGWCALVVVAIAYWNRWGKRAIWSAVALGLLLLLSFSTLAWGGQLWLQRTAPAMLVVESQASYTGPGSFYTVAPVLPPGTAGILVSEQSSWAEFKLSSGSTVWLPKSSLEPLYLP